MKELTMLVRTCGECPCRFDYDDRGYEKAFCTENDSEVKDLEAILPNCPLKDSNSDNTISKALEIIRKLDEAINDRDAYDLRVLHDEAINIIELLSNGV